MSDFVYNSDRFHDLAITESMGTLTPAEKSEFHALLHRAPAEDKKAWQAYRSTVLQMHAISEPVVPPDRVWNAINKQVIAREKARSASKPTFLGQLIERIASAINLDSPKFAFAVTVVLLATVAGLGIWSSQLQELNSTTQKELILLQSEVDQQRELLAILQAPRIDVVNMGGTESNPAGSGKVISDPLQRQAILQIANLPVIDETKDYQLWLIVGEQPISAGIFAVREIDDVFFKIEDLAETDLNRISAYAITQEPRGGVPSPTGPMVMLGAVSN